MILRVYYETDEGKKIVHIKNKKIVTKQDLEYIKRLIERKTGDKVNIITNWKIIGTIEEQMHGKR